MRLQLHLHRLAKAALALPLAFALAGPASAAAAPDAWVTTKVKLALATDEHVSARAVNVDTVEGRVTLHGTVGSAAEKAKAEQVARGIEGVREVRNLLQVVPERAKERAQISDDQLKQRVEAALKADRVLENSSIKVMSVNSGVVLLGGSADTLTDAYQAVDDASRVDGVVRVASEIKSPDELGDAELWRDTTATTTTDKLESGARDRWITTETKVRLMANTETPAFDINVDTRDGIVTLFGTVDSTRARDQAAVEARKVSGVRQVVNDLQVVAPSQAKRVDADDDAVEDSIEKRIGSDASLSDSEIHVEVEAGVARLTGTVKSRSDQVAALTIARATPGVQRVIDDLRLAAPSVSSR
jgi:osmotically-inducible protein OsmY